MEYSFNTKEIKDYAKKLKAGDRVLLSGTVYTSRDAAHKRIFELMEKGEKLPYEIDGASIYYAGPTPTPKGLAIGSCGPTTSSRMDPYAPKMLDQGLYSMIGKGQRSKEVCDAIIRNGYTIPYGCLVPKETDGLLLSGRNISGTHMAHSNFRAMPICLAIGEAGGVAAALSAKSGTELRDIDVSEIQKKVFVD